MKPELSGSFEATTILVGYNNLESGLPDVVVYGLYKWEYLTRIKHFKKIPLKNIPCN